MSGVTSSPQPCGYCGSYHQTFCPMVKAIEYHPDGTVKRVEFKTGADHYTVTVPDGPKPPWTVTCETPIVPMQHDHTTKDY